MELLSSSLIFYKHNTIPVSSRLHGWRLFLRQEMIPDPLDLYSITLQIWRPLDTAAGRFVLVHQSAPQTSLTDNDFSDVLATSGVMLSAGDVIGVRVDGVSPLIQMDDVTCVDAHVYSLDVAVEIGKTYDFANRTCLGFYIEILYDTSEEMKIIKKHMEYFGFSY